MAVERRRLRPYLTMESTQELLNDLLRLQSPPIPDGYQVPLGNQGLQPLGVNGGSIAAAQGTLLLSESEYRNRPIGLYFGLTDDDWSLFNTAVLNDLHTIFGRDAATDVGIVYTVTNARLRQLVTVSTESIAEWRSSDQRWTRNLIAEGTETRPRPLRMPRDGCRLSVRFVLLRNLDRDANHPLRPWRKGSWLASADIKIVATRGSGLLPKPLTEEAREMFGLGGLCTTYIDYFGNPEGVCHVGDLSTVMSVYVDEHLLHSVARRDQKGGFDKSASAALLTNWAADTYRALVQMIHQDPELEEFDLETERDVYSFTHLLLCRIRDSYNIPVEESLNVLKENPHRFVSLLEGTLGLKDLDGQLLELR